MSKGQAAVDGHVDCCADQTHNLTRHKLVLMLEALIYILGLGMKPKCLLVLFSPRQVVELISSAIGDVVQGLYYENCNSSEVKHRLRFYCAT